MCKRYVPEFSSTTWASAPSTRTTCANRSPPLTWTSRRPPISQAKLDKRGLLSFAFDGRYKFGRYYAPTAFNTPQSLEEIFKNNDVQLFDLQNDPDEVHNLALDREKNRATLLRMNALLNDLIAKEVGVNDGSFLKPYLTAK